MHKNKALALAFIVITSLNGQEFQPIRYERFLDQSKAALEARRKLLEQKVSEMQAHKQSAAQKKTTGYFARRSAGIQKIIGSTAATIETVQAQLEIINKRLLNLADLKKKIPALKIADSKAETALIKKAATLQNVADIEDEIRNIERLQDYFNKLPATEVDQAALRDLRTTWQKQRMDLTLRLTRERSAL